MKSIVFSILFLCAFASVRGQEEQPVNPNGIVTNSFWDNWYVQAGTDMILLFPKGYKKTEVFPNGKSLGVSLAVGKWFSHEFGAKFKVDWNNGLIKETHNVWYHPFGVRGGSYEHGGFLTFNGDLHFNLHNLFGEYKPDRKWNLSFSPRAGGWLNVKEGKGGPTLGVGLANTYRLSNKWRLFADVHYTFVPSMNGVVSGTDHGGNSYAEFNVGVEMDLTSKNSFHRASDNTDAYEHAVIVNSFWDNWFLQGGLDMTLHNPYGTNFSKVFPNGSTLGINLGAGKWFTPEVGIRGGINWQNALITNNKASYLRAKEDPNGKLDKKGTLELYADMFLNLHNILGGYSADRKWNAIVFPRFGIAQNFTSTYAECPVVGVGTEQTYAINDKVKLFADVVYQVTTSGYLDQRFKSPRHGISCNGWFDINVGVQYDLGWNKWGK